MYIEITILKISCIHKSVGNINGTVQQSEQGSQGKVECSDEHEDVNGVVFQHFDRNYCIPILLFPKKLYKHCTWQ